MNNFLHHALFLPRISIISSNPSLYLQSSIGRWLSPTNKLAQEQWHIRYFGSKYISKAAKKRLPMTTKRAGKGFYKGNGATKEGRLTSKGKFISDPKRKLQLVVPDLTGFTLKPYIASTASKFPPEIRRRPGQVA